jgi:hypothetical protein
MIASTEMACHQTSIQLLDIARLSTSNSVQTHQLQQDVNSIKELLERSYCTMGLLTLQLQQSFETHAELVKQLSRQLQQAQCTGYHVLGPKPPRVAFNPATAIANVRAYMHTLSSTLETTTQQLLAIPELDML